MYNAHNIFNKYRIIFTITSVLLVLMILPYIAISTYNFFRGDDTSLYVMVMEKGWLDTVIWYSFHSMFRPTFIGVYGGFATITQYFGLNPTTWQTISVCFDFLSMVIAFSILIKVLIPRIYPFLAFSIAALAILSVITSSLVTNIIRNNQLALTWVSANYSPSFALYCIVLSLFILFVGSPGHRIRYFFMLFVVMALYLGYHEVHMVSAFIIVCCASLLAFKINPDKALFSISIPALGFPSRISLRPEMDGFIYLGSMLGLFVLVAGALIANVMTPQFAGRATYTNNVTFLEALSTAPGIILDRLPEIFFSNNIYLVLLFVIAFLVARRFGINRGLTGWNGLVLLIPTVVAVGLVYGMAVGILMQTGDFRPRIVNYSGYYLPVALVCIAALLARLRIPFAPPRRLCLSLATCGILAVMVLIAQSPLYRVVFSTATGDGYRVGKGILKREQLLLMGRSGKVRLPAFDEEYIGEGGYPKYLPTVGTHLRKRLEVYINQLKKIYGVKEIEFIDCRGNPEIPECFFVRVPEP